ncbi:amidohydrolase family protein [Myxococcota bacterium]|nr:amidohydrolase family protein [Myxococcota bacterium]
MPLYDTVIRNGLIVDGTGAPRIRGDLAISAGRIAALGRIPAHQAKREIDATGCVVAPGFIDLHTHYDAQIFWDPYCSMSGWHGVTSVMIGNCGFGFAPVAPDARDAAMQSMTRVEAIPYETMKSSMPWDWETFPEFLDSVDRLPKAVNVQALAPLAPMVIGALGYERAKAGALPDEKEHAELLRLLGEALDAGAGGWSTQYLPPDSGVAVQKDFDGSPMVTDVMHEETLLALAEAMGRTGRGVIQVTLVMRDRKDSFDLEERIATASGRPLLHNVILVYAGNERWHQDEIAWLASCRERGVPIYGQAVTNCSGFWYEFSDWNLFDEIPQWAEATTGTHEEKLRKLADPDRRQGLRDHQPYVVTVPIPEHVITETRLEQNASFKGKTVGEAAQMLGVHPVDAMLDIAVSEDLRTEFYGDLPNHGYHCLDELLADSSVLPGVSDGGAHMKFTTPGRYTTELLVSSVRDRDWLTLEQAHWRLSGLPAHCAGFRDRGTLRIGAPADVVVYDLERLAVLPMERVTDLPAGQWRRVQRACGYRHVLVNGVPTIEDDRELSTAPGRLLRHGLG